MSDLYPNKLLGYIVKNGEINYCVTYDTSDCACKFACNEFISFIEQSTGARLPINQNATAKFISIGRTEQYYKIKDEIDTYSLKDDGFCLYTKDDNLYIIGFNGRGNIYGVYEFLERYIGLKFLAYDETIVPKCDNLPLYQFCLRILTLVHNIRSIKPIFIHH